MALPSHRWPSHPQPRLSRPQPSLGVLPRPLALRALLKQHDDHILPALRALPAVDFARLHDLFSQTVFNALVREHTPSESQNLDWADQSDPPAPVPFLTPDTPPGGCNPSTPPDGTPNVRPGDTASVFIEHDIDEGQYFWREVSPRPQRTLDLARGMGHPSESARHCADHRPSGLVALPRDVRALSGRAAYVGRAPTTALEHLPVRGYCTYPCSCRRPCGRCYGLCLRRIHLGERRGHPDQSEGPRGLGPFCLKIFLSVILNLLSAGSITIILPRPIYTFSLCFVALVVRPAFRLFSRKRCSGWERRATLSKKSACAGFILAACRQPLIMHLGFDCHRLPVRTLFAHLPVSVGAGLSLLHCLPSRFSLCPLP